MANDRIFIRCPKCLDVKKLLSYYPAGSAGPEREDSRGWAIEKWMDEHLQECGKVFSGDLAEVGPFFTLCIESPEVYDHIRNVQAPREAAKGT